MAYENIKFNRDNMAVYNNCFYMFDEYKDVLVQKTAGGSTSFQYPVNIDPSFTTYSNLSSVRCLQYDTFSFWTLQHFTDDSGVLLRRWVIDNYICNLIKQYPLVNDSFYTFDSYTFSLEYYITQLSNTYDNGSKRITIDEYTDSVVYPGTVIGLGPNKYGRKIFITVDHIDGNEIVLTSGLPTAFYSGDKVGITSSILLFNQYSPEVAGEGCLFLIDAESGDIISYNSNVEYKDVKASKFTRLQNILRDYNDVHTLIYVKGTNAKLRNLDDLHRYRAELKVSDEFEGSDGELPNSENWNITHGDPYILNNSLYCSTVGTSNDEIKSAYVLVNDFDVIVSGTLDHGMYLFNDSAFFHHYLGFYGKQHHESSYIARSVLTFYKLPITDYRFNDLVSYTLESPPTGEQPPEYTCSFSNNESTTTITGTYTVTRSGIETTHYLAYTNYEANICGTISLEEAIIKDYGTLNKNGEVDGTNIVDGCNEGVLWFDGHTDKVVINNYTANGNIKNVVFFEDFESGNTYQWLRFDGYIGSFNGFYNSPTRSNYTYGGDYLETKHNFGYSGEGDLYFYAWVRQSDNSVRNGPENGDDLIFYYRSSSGSWVEFKRLYGSDPYGTQYNVKEKLPSDAVNDDIRIRISNIGSYSGGDTWFVDDVYVAGEDFSTDSTALSLYFKFKPDFLSNVKDCFGVSNTLFCTSNSSGRIIFMDGFKNSNNWSINNGAIGYSVWSKYGNTVLRLYGNNGYATLTDNIDLSGFVDNVKLYVEIMNIAAESSDYFSTQYYNASGSWIELGRIYCTSVSRFTQTYTLGSDAFHSNFKIRLRVYSNYSGTGDEVDVLDVILYDANYGDVVYQPRPALNIGVSSSGNIQVYGTLLSYNNTTFFVELGSNDVLVDECNELVVLIGDNTVKAVINGNIYSTTVNDLKLANYTGSSTYIAYAPFYGSKFKGRIDEVKVFDYLLSDDEINLLESNDTVLNKLVTTTDVSSYYSHNSVNYNKYDYTFKVTRSGTSLEYYYNDFGSWALLDTFTVNSDELYVKMGLNSKLVSVSGTYFDYIRYSSGYVRYPDVSDIYYGIMNMDNIQSDNTTVIPVYDIDVFGSDLYRLQKKAMYYQHDYLWSTYNYQVSPLRSFIDFITVEADPRILPANGRNVSIITSVTLDQYGDGVINKPITFTDDDPVGFITTETVYTDVFNGTGEAKTVYKAGVDLRTVTITAKATQYD